MAKLVMLRLISQTFFSFIPSHERIERTALFQTTDFQRLQTFYRSCITFILDFIRFCSFSRTKKESKKKMWTFSIICCLVKNSLFVVCHCWYWYLYGYRVFLLNMAVQMENTTKCAKHEISFKMKTNYEEINTGEGDVHVDSKRKI